MFFTIQTLFKTLSLSIRSVQGSKQDFCRFQPNFFKGFCHLRPVRPLYPSFFLLFSVFMHFCHAFRDIFKPKGNWDF